MIDILIGATWTLLCLTLGFLVGLIVLAVLADREVPPDDYEDDYDEILPPNPSAGFLFESQLLDDQERERIQNELIAKWEEDIREIDNELR
jgi:hypothetical protein